MFLTCRNQNETDKYNRYADRFKRVTRFFENPDTEDHAYGHADSAESDYITDIGGEGR